MIATIGYRFAAAAGIAIGLAAALPAGAQSLDDLYAKAKDEGAFAFYVGGPTAPWEARAKMFEERYPGIKITIGGGFSNVLDKKIDQQTRRRKARSRCGDPANHRRLRALESRRPAADVQARRLRQDGRGVQGRDGTFWATMVNVVPYMYNTEKVAAADVPNSALDFLKPQFQGKIVTAYPADDDVTLWVFYHIVQKYGWSYMDKYMAAEAELHSGPSRRAAQHRLRTEPRHLRFDPRHHQRTEAPGPAGRFAFPDRRRAADLAAERRDLQGRAASERGEAVPVVAA